MTHTGNTQKHQSSNVLVSYAMQRYKNTLLSLLKDIGPEEILEAGCGEGFICEEIHDAFPHIPIHGFDIDSDRLSYAKAHHAHANITYSEDDIFSFNHQSSCILCLEVLEHIESYEKALEHISEEAEEHVVFSVPREPWFRLANLARLSYVSRLGNTPGHVNNWTKSGFKEDVERYFEVERVMTSLIWTFVVATP